MGIQVTDARGLGVPNLKARLMNGQNEVLKELVLNKKGLAKVLVNPKADQRYSLSVLHNDSEQLFSLPTAEELGFALILTFRKKSLLFNLRTNKTSLPLLKKDSYKLAIHNGSELKIVELPKFDRTSIATDIPKDILFDGINILTVLDQDNTPLMERICYYADNSKINQAKSHGVESMNDSLNIELNYADEIASGNMSISVLPKLTQADHQQESIASFNLLASHLSRAGKNAATYFADGAPLYKDLDLMLLTQGWSAYDWSNIMYLPPKPEYEFERGIKATIGASKNNVKNWIAFPHQGIELKRFRPLLENTVYSTDSLFPYEEEKLRISEINKKGNFRKPFVKGGIEFLPNKIPSIDRIGKTLAHKVTTDSQISSNNFDFALPIDRNTIELEEVVVAEDKIEDERLKNLIDYSFGEVTVFDEELRKKWPNAISFLQKQLGFRVTIDSAGKPIITNRLPGIPPPSVFLDAATLQSPVLNGEDDLSLLIGLRTTDIGYIEVNRFGLGEGIRGAGGVIRIFTRTDYSDDYKRPYKYGEFEYPLTFDRPEKYVVPVYNSYTDESYLKYGVLGWFPNLNLNEGKNVSFKILNTGLNSIRLNIQGFSDDGNFFA